MNFFFIPELLWCCKSNFLRQSLRPNMWNGVSN